MTTRDILPDSHVAPTASAVLQAFHQDYVAEVKAAVSKNAVVVVGMGQNPVVRKAKGLLTEKNIAFTSVEHGNYFSGWKRRLAVKMWAGFPTFPMVFLDGVLVGGASELKTMLDAGTFVSKTAK
jgi:monothiol glutaredoxin